VPSLTNDSEGNKFTSLLKFPASAYRTWDGVLRNVLLVSVGFAMGSLIVRNIERRECREGKSPSLKGPRGKVNEDYRATAA
jgi:hypothetical protein